MRQDELAIVGRRERAHPGVEELHGLRAGGDLAVQVVGGDLGEARHEGVPGRRLRAHEALGVEEVPRGAALDQVRGEREGRPREADEGQAVGERLAREPHRLEDVADGRDHVHAREPRHLGRAPDRPGDVRALAPRELEPDAEWLQHEQDVGEEDGRVHAEALDRLERHLRRRRRRLAQLEEAVARAQRAVLGHVAPRLAHQPDRRERGLLASAGAEERRIRVRHRECSVSSAPGGVKEGTVSSRT